MYALQRQIEDLRKRLKNERRGHSNHHVSSHVKVRQNVSNRLKARQMCPPINCTGPPIIMHRTPNTNSRTSNAINTQRVCQTRVHKSLIGSNLPDALSLSLGEQDSVDKQARRVNQRLAYHQPNVQNDGTMDDQRNQPTISVGAARKASPNWSQETMTCHSSNCFSIVWGQGNAATFNTQPLNSVLTYSLLSDVLL